MTSPFAFRYGMREPYRLARSGRGQVIATSYCCLMDPTADADAAALAAAATIAAETDAATHDVAVVLGSGWAPAAGAFGRPVRSIPMASVPGFTPPRAAGHGGMIHSVRIGDRRVLILLGRIHAYEGHHLARVVHPVRTAAATGVGTIVLTNAAGGLRDDMTVGQPLSLIHI